MKQHALRGAGPTLAIGIVAIAASACSPLAGGDATFERGKADGHAGEIDPGKGRPTTSAPSCDGVTRAGVLEQAAVAAGHPPELQVAVTQAIRHWLASAEGQLQVVKRERHAIGCALDQGGLPAGYAVALSPPGSPLAIELSYTTEYGGVSYQIGGTPYLDLARTQCGDPALCTEPFASSPPAGLSFPASVAVRITETSATGACLIGSGCVADALSIAFQLTTANLADLAAYLSVGFAPAQIHARLMALVGTTEWVTLEQILPNWVGLKANTFPVEDDNEVCHGPARQFFHAQLKNGAYDRSTEPVATLLHDFYCRLDDARQPTFGDYLYIPMMHSGRFVLRDPQSGRWIGFSVQSGGMSAYRFWWVDEDFSGAPFDRSPLATFRTDLVDVWRRCR